MDDKLRDVLLQSKGSKRTEDGGGGTIEEGVANVKPMDGWKDGELV